jgi:ERCC4-related helicase
MAPTDDAHDGGTATNGTATIRLRSYQTEMVEESLKSNILVAMDTGSGKTNM